MLRRLLPPIVIALIALAGFQWRIRHEMADFAVYRQAAARLMHAEPLYRASDGHYQFKYLPAFAFLAVPFAWMDEDTAKVIWFAASIGALALLVRWSVRFLPEYRRSQALLIGLTLVFMAKFYAHELVLGQSNVFFAVLAVSAIGAMQVDAEGVAGTLLGLAVCIKPYALLFAPWLLVNGRRGDRRAFGNFVLTCAVAIVLPSLVYGVKGNAQLLADWWRTVSASTGPNLTGNDNVSFAAMWTKWIGASRLSQLLTGLTSAGALGVVISAWRKRGAIDEPVYLETAALLILVPLLSPQGWDYVLLLGTPAVVLLLDRMPELTRGWQAVTWTALAVMGLTWFDVMGRALYGRFMALSLVTVAATALLVALTHVRRRGLA